MKKLTRRDFLQITGIGLSSIAVQQLLTSCEKKLPVSTESTLPTKTPFQIETPPQNSQNQEQPTLTNTPTEYPEMVVTRGDQPEELVNQGIKALGGMERFMKPGADVIIKPNICIAYHTYEYAATTNPWVVGALVKLCVAAGAKRVRVMDFPFGGSGKDAYRNSGIEEQVLAAGGELEDMTPLKYAEVAIENAVALKKVSVYQDILNTDLLINVPVAKNHGMAKLTLGLKNLMGTIQNREQIHPSFEKNLVDLATLVRPQLTVIDAVRTLMANGPTGGNLDDVQIQNTVILSPDIVAADSFATSLFGKQPDYLPYVIKAAERGLGKADLSNVRIEEINLNA